MQIELPSEYGTWDQEKTSPVAILAVYQGSRMSLAAPDWVKMAAHSPVFWQPRTLMTDLITITAMDKHNKERWESILNWVANASDRKDYVLP